MAIFKNRQIFKKNTRELRTSKYRLEKLPTPPRWELESHQRSNIMLPTPTMVPYFKDKGAEFGGLFYGKQSNKKRIVMYFFFSSAKFKYTQIVTMMVEDHSRTENNADFRYQVHIEFKVVLSKSIDSKIQFIGLTVHYTILTIMFLIDFQHMSFFCGMIK